MSGSERIAAERQRQIDAEGWSAEHDRSHNEGTLAGAALCYLTWAHGQLQGYTTDSPPYDWPWDEGWWKPSEDPIRNLEKAGALIAAEIDRLTGEER